MTWLSNSGSMEEIVKKPILFGKNPVFARKSNVFTVFFHLTEFLWYCCDISKLFGYFFVVRATFAALVILFDAFIHDFLSIFVPFVEKFTTIVFTGGNCDFFVSCC